MTWRLVLPPPKGVPSCARDRIVSVGKTRVGVSKDIWSGFEIDRFDLYLGDGGSFAIDLCENGAWRAQKGGKCLGAKRLVAAIGLPVGLYPVVVEGTKLVHYAPGTGLTENGLTPSAEAEIAESMKLADQCTEPMSLPEPPSKHPKVTRPKATVGFRAFLKGGEYEIAETAVGLLNIARALALGNKLDDVAQRFGCKMARLAKFGEAFGPCLFEFENAAEAQRPLVFDVWLEWFREAGK